MAFVRSGIEPVLTECFVCSLKVVYLSCVGVSMETSSIYCTITWVCLECHETGKPERKTDEMADRLFSIETKLESMDTLTKLVNNLSDNFNDNTSTQVQQKPINLTYASLLAGNAGSGQPPNKEPFARKFFRSRHGSTTSMNSSASQAAKRLRDDDYCK